MAKDNIIEFETGGEEFEKLVDKKLDQIKDIVAPPEFAELFERFEGDPEAAVATEEARLQRAVMDLYASQAALFQALPRNIAVLIKAGLIPEEAGAKLYVLAKMLEVGAQKALEAGMDSMTTQAEKEAAKPDLKLVH